MLLSQGQYYILRPDYLFDSPVISVIIIIMTFIFGACIGSFLNVCIIRIPLGESLVKKSSHCMTCGEPIKWYDLIPILSWVILGGKCRGCKEKISGRYALVESLTGIIAVTALIRFGISAGFFINMIYFSLLVVIGFTDWDTQEMMIVELLAVGVLAIPAFLFIPNSATLIERLIGIAVISVPFLIIALITKGIGMGDVILMACAGAFLGYKAVIASAFIGIITAAIAGIIIKFTTKISKMAFGPWLCVGLYFGAMFGTEMFNWYLMFLKPQ